MTDLTLRDIWQRVDINMDHYENSLRGDMVRAGYYDRLHRTFKEIAFSDNAPDHEELKPILEPIKVFYEKRHALFTGKKNVIINDSEDLSKKVRPLFAEKTNPKLEAIEIKNSQEIHCHLNTLAGIEDVLAVLDHHLTPQPLTVKRYLEF